MSKLVRNLGLLAGTAAVLASIAFDASAATIRVQCEQRTGRAKISVDGNNLTPGSYTAQVISGANSAQSRAQTAIGDEAQFDFDSNPRDIAEGATGISQTFIQGQVTGKILNNTGATVISDTVNCRIRR